MLWDILWRNKNAFSLTFCIAFSVISILWQRNPFAQGIGYFGRLADRLSGALNSGVRLTGSLWVELDKYRELEQRYEQAQKTLEEYRLEKDKFDLLRLENQKLREALSFPVASDYEEIKAEVLGVRLNTLSPRIIINRGRAQGVAPLMPVVTRAHDADQNLIRCVVGVIASVDENTSVVQPLIHPSFRMGVRIAESGEWAILSGNSGRAAQTLLTYVTTDSAPDRAFLSHAEIDIRKARLVYSSGEGGIFPPGIPVGRIVAEGPRDGEFKTAYIAPIAPITNLDIVQVIRKRPEPWSAQWDQAERWEEHLETEFGPPVYNEATLRQQARPDQRNRGANENAAEGANGGAEPPPTGAQNGAQTQPPAGGEAPRLPRRIQNLNAPGQGQ